MARAVSYEPSCQSLVCTSCGWIPNDSFGTGEEVHTLDAFEGGRVRVPFGTTGTTGGRGRGGNGSGGVAQYRAVKRVSSHSILLDSEESKRS